MGSRPCRGVFFLVLRDFEERLFWRLAVPLVSSVHSWGMEEQLEKEIREEFTVSTPRKKHSTPSVVKREPSKETDEEIFEIVDYTLASPWEK